jgi:hypothetical protein
MMIEMNKDDATVIIKLAQKLIGAIEQELKDKQKLRESGDHHDNTDVNMGDRQGYQKCEDCND